MSFSLPYAYWLILPSLFAAAALSWWLYRGNPLKIASKPLRLALLAGRFVLWFFLFFLLLGPLVNLTKQLLRKPNLVVFVDNSASMIAGADSAKTAVQIQSAIQQIKETLNEQVDLVSFQFDSKVRSGADSLNFKGQSTAISTVIEEANNELNDQPSAGMILISDGIVNRGADPLSLSDLVNFPVYTLRAGDTIPYKDLAVQFVRSSELVFEGNNFKLEGAVSAFDCQGQSTTIRVFEAGKLIASKNVIPGSSNDYLPFSFELDAGKEGLHTYEVRLDKVSGEKTVLNNSTSIAVQVLKSKQRIKIVYLNPHPDIAALKALLSTNKNFELEISDLRQHQFNPSSESDLYIFHQIPGSGAEGLGLIKQVSDRNIPQLFILGAQSGIPYLNNLDLGFSIEGFRPGANEVKPHKNETFSLFHDDNEASFYSKLPPLNAPYGNYRFASGTEVFLYQQIGQVKTQIPLWFFTGNGYLRRGIIAGDGIWRWKLYDFQMNQNFQASSALLMKSVQLLAGREDKGRFRVKSRKRIYDESESVQFDAWWFNEAFEPDNQKELVLEISSAKSKPYSLSFNRNSDAYELDAGALAPGVYSWKAYFQNASSDTKSGSFVVKSSNLEQLNTLADHAMLRTLSANSGGASFLLNQSDRLVDYLKNLEKSKPIIQVEHSVQELINQSWILVVLIAIAALEWFIRKWQGFI